jgi:hypothetical protein
MEGSIMRYLGLAIIIIVVLMVFFAGEVAVNANPLPRPPANIVYEPLSVMINGQRISPGDSLLVVIGIAGFPDQMRAMRGKKDKTQDYIHLNYLSLGLSVDISSDTNIVQGIIIEDQRLKIPNFPFKIGDPYQKPYHLWGKGDNETPGYLTYWDRGVYLVIGDEGKIITIFLTQPGKEEEDTKK